MKYSHIITVVSVALCALVAVALVSVSTDHRSTVASVAQDVPSVVTVSEAPSPDVSLETPNDTAEVAVETTVPETAPQQDVLVETRAAPVERALPAYTAETLQQYDGENQALPIYIAFKGNVYDVTQGKKFYEPGGAYHFLAGTDGTKLLSVFGGDIIEKKYPIVGVYK